MASDSTAGTPASGQVGGSHRERRNNRRCKITQVLRARPSDPELDQFEDVRATLSVSRTGLFFHTNVRAYTLGLRLFVTVPYSNQPTLICREYLAEVVRVESLDSGRFGVGLKLLMEIGFRESFVESSIPTRR
ncbi:MAG: PilZ domain-containing protein [Candidatus Acidiferrales bacterium]